MTDKYVNDIVAAAKRKFDPKKHPRGKDGKFIKKGFLHTFLTSNKPTISQLLSAVGALSVKDWDNLKPEHQKYIIDSVAKIPAGTSTHTSLQKKLTTLGGGDTPTDWTKSQDFSQFKKIGGQKGSNVGGTFTSPTGEQWYIKQAKTPKHAANEQAASAFYNTAGISSPQVMKGTGVSNFGDLQTGTKIVPDAKQSLAGSKIAPEFKTEVQRGFAMDAWLANWDVVGLGYDNIVEGPDGKPHRIDVGGALLYRAQGKPKGSAFGSTVPEIDTLRDFSKNPQAAKVYGDMTDDQIRDSVALVAAFDDATIDKIVSDAGLPKSVAETLKSRRDDLTSKYPPKDVSSQTPSTPKASITPNVTSNVTPNVTPKTATPPPAATPAAPTQAVPEGLSGKPGDSAKVTTKLIWAKHPAGTTILESADGNERVVWNGKKYEHQLKKTDGTWDVTSAYTKKDAYAELKSQTKWQVPGGQPTPAPIDSVTQATQTSDTLSVADLKQGSPVNVPSAFGSSYTQEQVLSAFDAAPVGTIVATDLNGAGALVKTGANSYDTYLMGGDGTWKFDENFNSDIAQVVATNGSTWRVPDSVMSGVADVPTVDDSDAFPTVQDGELFTAPSKPGSSYAHSELNEALQAAPINAVVATDDDGENVIMKIGPNNYMLASMIDNQQWELQETFAGSSNVAENINDASYDWLVPDAVMSATGGTSTDGQAPASPTPTTSTTTVPSTEVPQTYGFVDDELLTVPAFKGTEYTADEIVKELQDAPNGAIVALHADKNMAVIKTDENTFKQFSLVDGKWEFDGDNGVFTLAPQLASLTEDWMIPKNLEDKEYTNAAGDPINVASTSQVSGDIDVSNMSAQDIANILTQTPNVPEGAVVALAQFPNYAKESRLVYMGTNNITGKPQYDWSVYIPQNDTWTTPTFKTDATFIADNIANAESGTINVTDGITLAQQATPSSPLIAPPGSLNSSDLTYFDIKNLLDKQHTVPLGTVIATTQNGDTLKYIKTDNENGFNTFEWTSADGKTSPMGPSTAASMLNAANATINVDVGLSPVTPAAPATPATPAAPSVIAYHPDDPAGYGLLENKDAANVFTVPGFDYTTSEIKTAIDKAPSGAVIAKQSDNLSVIVKVDNETYKEFQLQEADGDWAFVGDHSNTGIPLSVTDANSGWEVPEGIFTDNYADASGASINATAPNVSTTAPSVPSTIAMPPGSLQTADLTQSQITNLLAQSQKVPKGTVVAVAETGDKLIFADKQYGVNLYELVDSSAYPSGTKLGAVKAAELLDGLNAVVNVESGLTPATPGTTTPVTPGGAAAKTPNTNATAQAPPYKPYAGLKPGDNIKITTTLVYGTKFNHQDVVAVKTNEDGTQSRVVWSGKAKKFVHQTQGTSGTWLTGALHSKKSFWETFKGDTWQVPSYVDKSNVSTATPAQSINPTGAATTPTSTTSTPTQSPASTANVASVDLGTGDISGINDVAKQNVFDTFKKAPYDAKTVNGSSKAVYENAKSVAQQYGINTLQALKVIDEYGAQKANVPNKGLFELKIKDWLKTPTGAAQAQGLPVPLPPTPELNSIAKDKIPSFAESSNYTYKTVTVTKAAGLFDQSVADSAPLTQEQLDGLKQYTSNDAFAINNYLYGGGVESLSSSKLKAAEQAQLALRPSQVPMLLLRGVSYGGFGDAKNHNDLEKLVGQTWKNGGFTSASAGKVPGFSYHPVWVEIEAPPGTPMAWVGKSPGKRTISYYPNENEMLLKAGLNVKVISVTKNAAGKSVVRVRVVPDEE